MKMANLRITFAALSALTFLSGTAVANESAGSCIIKQHFYYPKEGMNEQALATRIKTAEIRKQLGLPAGRILVVQSAISGHPSKGEPEPLAISYITSLTEYASENAAEAADEELEKSEDFRAARAEMGSMLKHFEAAKWYQAWGNCAGDGK